MRSDGRQHALISIHFAAVHADLVDRIRARKLVTLKALGTGKAFPPEFLDEALMPQTVNLLQER